METTADTDIFHGENEVAPHPKDLVDIQESIAVGIDVFVCRQDRR